VSVIPPAGFRKKFDLGHRQSPDLLLHETAAHEQGTVEFAPALDAKPGAQLVRAPCPRRGSSNMNARPSYAEAGPRRPCNWMHAAGRGPVRRPGTRVERERAGGGGGGGQARQPWELLLQ
jgi:hypothetical protein